MAVNGTNGTNGTGGEQLVGLVAAVNPNGIRLEGRERWLNFSKFAPGLTPPRRGQRVTVQLDKAGFVRAIETAAGGSHQEPPAGPTKDQTITRLACLKAASEFSAGRADIKSGDVLRIAESWEGWITRD